MQDAICVPEILVKASAPGLEKNSELGAKYIRFFLSEFDEVVKGDIVNSRPQSIPDEEFQSHIA